MNSYDLVMEKYTKNKIEDFKFKTADEVKKVLKYDFRTIRGFKDLNEEHKDRAEKLICMYLNRWGLETREDIRPTGIKYCIENGMEFFKVNIKNNGYIRLLFNGGVA